MKLTRELILGLIEEVIDEILLLKQQKNEARREDKPNCSPSNAYHDFFGRFSTKPKAKSFSLKFSTPKNSKDCVGGQSRMPGQRFAKLPAGRKTKTGGKEKWKLKDGTPAY